MFNVSRETFFLIIFPIHILCISLYISHEILFEQSGLDFLHKILVLELTIHLLIF